MNLNFIKKWLCHSNRQKPKKESKMRTELSSGSARENFRVCPMPSPLAICCGREARLLEAWRYEPRPPVDGLGIHGGACLVWTNWDLFGRPQPQFECASKLDGAGTEIRLKYAMAVSASGDFRGRVSFELVAAAAAPVSVPWVSVRITAMRSKRDYIWSGPAVVPRGKMSLKRAWTIKPFSGRAVASVLITHGRPPKLDEWAALDFTE